MTDKNNKPEHKPLLLTLEETVEGWLMKNVRNTTKFVTISAIIIIISITATNLLTLTIIPNYLYFIASTPAAITATLLTVYYVEILFNKISEYKEKLLPKERLRNSLIGTGIVALLLMIFNIYLPEWLSTGIGGVLIIVAAYILTTTAGKTATEHRYYMLGVVDPREEV